MDNDKTEERVEGENAETQTSQKSFQMDNYQSLNKSGSGRKKFIVTLILIAILAAVGWFAVSLFSGSSGETKPTQTTVTESPTPTPTPEPSPAINKSEWSFEILNGSGEAGLAKKIGDRIKALGYEVVKVGNADKSDYATTQIFVKNVLKDKVNLIVADLKDAVKIASYAGELKDSTASARIILGLDSAD